MSLPTSNSHDINLFPDVSAVAAHLVHVPINSNGAPDAAQIEEEIPALDSENDSDNCKIHAGTWTYAIFISSFLTFTVIVLFS